MLVLRNCGRRCCDLRPLCGPNSAIAACGFAFWGVQTTMSTGGLGLRFSNRSGLTCCDLNLWPFPNRQRFFAAACGTPLRLARKTGKKGYCNWRPMTAQQCQTNNSNDLRYGELLTLLNNYLQKLAGQSTRAWECQKSMTLSAPKWRDSLQLQRCFLLPTKLRC